MPVGRTRVLKYATPPDTWLVLNGVPPLKKTTVPVALPAVVPLVRTVAVKVTLWLGNEGLSEDASAVVVATATLCVTVEERLAP